MAVAYITFWFQARERFGHRRPSPGFNDPGAASRRLLGLESPDHLQRVADVLADVGHRVEHVPDLALAVDHVGDPARYQA